MNSNQRKVLEQHLDQLDRYEREKLFRRAMKFRQAAQKGKKSPRKGNKLRAHAWQSDLKSSKTPRKNSQDSVRDWALRLLEQEIQVSADPREPTEDAQQGTVVALGPGLCQVLSDGIVQDCVIASHLRQVQQTELAVGDQVDWSNEPEPTVFRVHPRKTRLSRPDPGNSHRERVLLANIDRVVLVVSVKTPPLHPRLIDRFLIGIQKGGAQPLVCVNKMDLLEEKEDRLEELSKLTPYEQLGVPIIPCSTTSGEGLQALRALLGNQTSALVGHSGVGKSSLLQALIPGVEARTNSVRAADGKGRHTTTGSTLYPLEAGGCIIDTPGIRSFGLWKIGPEELLDYFPEFLAAAERCKYRNCLHLEEPGCQVQAAVESGEVSVERLESYFRLQESLASEA